MNTSDDDAYDDVMSMMTPSSTDDWYVHSLNLTEERDIDANQNDDELVVWRSVVFGLIAAAISLVTIGGNSIVILSFIIERSIRQPSNYFIASLAVSDLLIG